MLLKDLFSNKKAVVLAVMFIIESLAITRPDSTLSTDGVKSLLHMINILCAFFVLFIPSKNTNLNTNISKSILLLPVFVWWIIQYFDVDNMSESTLNLLTVLSMVALWLATPTERRSAFEYYRYFLVASSFYGIIVFIAFVLPLNISYEVVPFYGIDTNVTYINYYLAYLIVHVIEGVRLCGLYNEPGYLGTFIGLFLFADGYNLKRKSNYILIIAGCLTFSVAFFVTIVLGLVMLSYKKKKVIISLIAVAAIFFFVLPNIDLGDGALNTFYERFRIEDGKIVADNRSGGFDDMFSRAMSNPDRWLWGYGTGSLVGKITAVASYKTYIYQYGYFGAFLMWCVLFFVGVRLSQRNAKAIMFLLLFFANVYQRPHIFTFSYFILLYGGIEYMLWKDNEADGNNQIASKNER